MREGTIIIINTLIVHHRELPLNSYNVSKHLKCSKLGVLLKLQFNFKTVIRKSDLYFIETFFQESLGNLVLCLVTRLRSAIFNCL